MKNKARIFTLTLGLLLIFVNAAMAATNFSSILKQWTKERYYADDGGANLTIKCTYFSSEYVDAYILSEAQKNMWTQSETDDFKYKFLKTLNLNEMIPINVEFVNNGPTMFVGPFDNFVSLRIKNKLYKPVDYDKRFNFKFQGKKDGLIYFPRFDEKTGKDLLAGVSYVTLEFKSAISTTLDGKNPNFIWDVKNDNPQKLYEGGAGARMETDRLIKRLEKLRKDKAEEESKINAINNEISTIQQRVDELAKQ